MRLISTFSLPALCWRLAGATDDTGRIYVHNPYQAQAPGYSTATTQPLRPQEARVVLAQRMGVEEFHAWDFSLQSVVDVVNDYGVRSPIFAEQSQERVKRALLYVEGEKNKKYLDTLLPTSVAISDSPSSQSAWDLYSDLQAQSLALGLHDEFLSFLEEASAEQTVQRLAKSNTALTILYLPPTPRAYGARVEWGSYYPPPNAVLPLHRRSPPSEKPLEISSDNSNFEPVQSSTSLNTLASSPLPGILPACFPSLSSCEKYTRNCTGHGSCALKYTDFSSDPEKQCYTCQCSASVKKDEDGKISTTYWGGPACQKRDVSVQFWLIALFTVGLVGLVSFAVGQVWSMGEEELPSVIGAGVSGPVARR